MEVVDQFTDCDVLRRQSVRALQPRSASAHRAVVKAHPDVINDNWACSMDQKSPHCTAQRRNNAQRVQTVNRIVAGAQSGTVRSVEAAINRSMTNRVRYDQAVCTKLQQQVL